MDWCILTLFLGAILSLFLPIVPEFSLLILILSLSFALLWHKKYQKLALCLMGMSWVLFAAGHYLAQRDDSNIWAASHFPTQASITGEIRNIAAIKDTAMRFKLLVTHVNGQLLAQRVSIRLRWDKPTYWVQQGQVWTFLVKLKPAHGLANPGAFNYQTWLMQQDVIATGYIKKSNKNRLINSEVSWRAKVYRHFYSLLPEHKLTPILVALGFGERSLLESTHWQVLGATATQHLIAISGLHIGLVAYASLLLLRVILQFIPLGKLISASQQPNLMRFNLAYLPIIGSCLMAGYYSYLAGFSIPTLRALTMLYVYWGFRFLGLNLSPSRSLLLAIIFILLMWPLNILSMSFWLSVSALTIIFITLWRFPNLHSNALNDYKSLDGGYRARISDIIQRCWRWLKPLLLIQFALTLVMLPVAASLSYQIPLLAYFANLIAVPLMSISTIPLTLLSVILTPISEVAASWTLTLALQTLEIIWQWLTFLADAKWAMVSISVEHLKLLSFILFLSIISTLLHLSWRWSILPILLFLLYLMVSIFDDNQHHSWRVNVLDVGHGLAVIIEKDAHVVIYDTGAAYPSGFNISEAAITPYLISRGYQKIDKVIISHNDNDHAGGLTFLREQFAIDTVIANSTELKADQTCIAGRQFTWQGLQFEVLSPETNVGENNDDSCVIRINDGKHSILLTGDISTRVERILVSSNTSSIKLESDILIVPHHGSKSSSSVKFLSAVAPSFAVFSTGYLNQWHMPSKPIRQRYKDLGIQTFNTADQGMIEISFTDEINIKRYRTDLVPFWFSN